MTMSDMAELSRAGSTGTPVLEVSDLEVSYGSGDARVQAVDGMTFTVNPGEFVCVVGPSGCGKTTLLKSLAGLLRPTGGDVKVAGRAVDGPPDGLALVFQEYTRSLLPWLTVMGNVTFPLAAKGVSRAEREKRGRAALREVALDGVSERYPWQLSGGMQQRVAIARAIAYEPVILLMDEPFASVDAQTRADLEDLLLRVQRDTGTTVLFVTHDIDEAVYLGHRTLVLANRPTSVRVSLDIPLPFPRDQLATKAHTEFVDLRSKILALIRQERAEAAQRDA